VADPAGVASLYERAPSEFVAARSELAKALRTSGDREGADEVAKLPRPTVPAWGLDQVARRAPDLIDALLQAGHALRDAMAAAVRGDATSLRAAEAAERAAADAVADRAVGEAAAAGVALNDAHRQRMTATLRAAVLDDGVAAQLRAGTLDSDHEAPPLGFDAGADVAHPAPRPKPTRTTAEARAHRAELERLRKEAEQLGRRADRLGAEAEQAAQQAAALRAQAKAAASAARDAQRRLATAERAPARRSTTSRP
jgi:hypothetical protein